MAIHRVATDHPRPNCTHSEGGGTRKFAITAWHLAGLAGRLRNQRLFVIVDSGLMQGATMKRRRGPICGITVGTIVAMITASHGGAQSLGDALAKLQRDNGAVAPPLPSPAKPAMIPIPEPQGEQRGIRMALIRSYTIEGRRVAILSEDWIYCYPPTGEVILVPKGYMTDFASIPAVAEFFFDSFGKHAEAAVVHDWLYAVGAPGQKSKADSIFRFAMEEQGVPARDRDLMYAAVSVGGTNAYGRAGEWDRRFGDPDTGRPLPRSPFVKPATPVVQTVSDCAALDAGAGWDIVRVAFGSDAWPKVRTEARPKQRAR